MTRIRQTINALIPSRMPDRKLVAENERLKNLIIGCAGAVNPEDAIAILKAEVRRIKALKEPDDG